MKLSILILLSLIISIAVSAQDVAGEWYGVGTVHENGNNYLCELVLNQKGTKVTGQFNYYFRTGYFTNNIEGSYDAATRKLKIAMFPIIYFRATNTETGVDCPMDAELTLKVSRAETTLSGKFITDELHGFTCRPINIRLTKQTGSNAIPADNSGDTLIPVAAMLSKTVAVPQEMTIPERETIIQVKRRAKDIVKELEVSEDSVRIDLYDNGEFDHDSVTVLYNDKILQYKKELQTRNPITFYVHVNEIAENNDLVMFAENLGEIPPNSALMIVTDKAHRYEITVVSNYQKNGAIRLKKKE